MVVCVALLVDFGTFLMPKWSQRGTKVDAQTHRNAKGPQSLKSYTTNDFSMNIVVRGDQFWKQKYQRIAQKTGPTWTYGFTSPLCRFWVDLSPSLGGKSVKKSIEKAIEKTDLEKTTAEGLQNAIWDRRG